MERYGYDMNSLLWHKEPIPSISWSKVLQDVMRVLMDDHLMSVGFKENLLFSVGDGKRVSFWNDSWASDLTLSNSFPRLYAMSQNKMAKIADVGVFRGSKWQ